MPRSTKTLCDQVRRLLADGSLDEAYAVASSALIESKSPTVCGTAAWLRSVVLLQQHEYGRALLDAQECVSRLPQWYKGYAQACILLQRVGRFEDAMVCIEEGLRHNPASSLLQTERSRLADCIVEREVASVLDELVSSVEHTTDERVYRATHENAARWLE